MHDDRDRDFLAAADHIGTASAHVLTFHPVSEEFDTFDALAHRLELLVEDGLLDRRELPDVLGDPVTEYETVDGWTDQLGLDSTRPES